MRTPEQDRFIELASRRVTGVGVVTARIDSWDHAAVISDFLFVSYDPPTILVSLYELSRMCEALTEADSWVLNIMATDQLGSVERLAEPGAPLIGLLGRIPYTRRADAGPAWLTGAIAAFECTTVAIHEAATHQLFVGEVQHQDGPPNPLPAPLVRYRSQFSEFQSGGTIGRS